MELESRKLIKEEEDIQANMALMAFSDSDVVREEENLRKLEVNNDRFKSLKSGVSVMRMKLSLSLSVEKKTVIPTATKKEFVKPEKLVRRTVRYAEIFDHLQYTCKHKRHVNDQKQVKSAWKNTRRVNDYYSTRMTHSNPRRNMIPQAVLMRSRIKAVNTAKPKDAHNVVKTNWFHDVKASTCWVWRPKQKEILDNVSKHNNGCIDSGEARVQQRKRRIQRRVQQKQKDQEDEVFGRILSAKKMKSKLVLPCTNLRLLKKLTTAGYRVTTVVQDYCCCCENVNAAKRLLVCFTEVAEVYSVWGSQVVSEPVRNSENGPVSITTDTQGQIKVLPPRTVEEIVARERERKARTTLLMALPEDHLAKFHKMTDAKEMWDAIKSRFGGNDESKKMPKYILKQQFEGFSISNSEGLHKGYDRFQSLLSQLEIHGAGVSTEDANQKLLRSLPSAWNHKIGSKEDLKHLLPCDGEGCRLRPVTQKKMKIMLMACTHSSESDTECLNQLSMNLIGESQPKVWSDAPIIEEYESDSEDEYVSIPTKQQETPSFANQQVKTPRETVKNQFTHSQKPKVDKKELGYGFTVRACFVCGSLNHLIRDCDFHEKRMARKAELNNELNRNISWGAREISGASRRKLATWMGGGVPLSAIGGRDGGDLGYAICGEVFVCSISVKKFEGHCICGNTVSPIRAEHITIGLGQRGVIMSVVSLLYESVWCRLQLLVTLSGDRA
ncbi:hypothetical protein Tco_0619309 [Tanacetum coccineum]